MDEGEDTIEGGGDAVAAVVDMRAEKNIVFVDKEEGRTVMMVVASEGVADISVVDTIVMKNESTGPCMTRYYMHVAM